MKILLESSENTLVRVLRGGEPGANVAAGCNYVHPQANSLHV